MPRVFDSCHSIKTQGEKVASLKLASERDLLILQHTIVETPVTEIVNHLKSVDSVYKKFGLAGGIKFHNHKNALSDDADEVAQQLEAQQLGLPSGPQPDSVCVFTTVELLNKPALVVEYKAPHKLTLAHLRLVLNPDHPPLELDSIINAMSVPSHEDEVAHFKYHAERLVAAVVTQTFSYMVRCGTQSGYIATGELPSNKPVSLLSSLPLY